MCVCVLQISLINPQHAYIYSDCFTTPYTIQIKFGGGGGGGILGNDYTKLPIIDSGAWRLTNQNYYCSSIWCIKIQDNNY